MFDDIGSIIILVLLFIIFLIFNIKNYKTFHLVIFKKMFKKSLIFLIIGIISLYFVDNIEYFINYITK